MPGFVDSTVKDIEARLAELESEVKKLHALMSSAVTTTKALGRAGRLSTTPARNARSLSQACGPNGGGDSIQKQGPPPCGTNIVGWRGDVMMAGSLFGDSPGTGASLR